MAQDGDGVDGLVEVQGGQASGVAGPEPGLVTRKRGEPVAGDEDEPFEVGSEAIQKRRRWELAGSHEGEAASAGREHGEDGAGFGPGGSAGEATEEAAIVEAEEIITHRVDDFLHWLEARETVPTIRALRDAGERMRRHELEHALKLLQRGDDPAQVLEALSKGLTNKLLHPPTQALNLAEGAERGEVAQVISRIWHLHPEK